MPDPRPAPPEPLLGWLAKYLNAPIDVVRGLVAGSEDTPWAKTGVLLGALPTLKPLSVVGGLRKAADEALDVSHAARMQRAAEQGFTLDAYHGSGFPGIGLPENPNFTLSPNARTTSGGMTERGVFATDNPEFASDFAEWAGVFGGGPRTGATVYPVKIRPGRSLGLNPAQFDRLQEVMGMRRRGEAVPEVKQIFLETDLEALTGQRIPEGTDPVQWLADQGYDSITLQAKPGTPRARESEIMVLDPRNVRGRFAKFDPRKVMSNELLAGLGGGVLLSSLGRPQEPR